MTRYATNNLLRGLIAASLGTTLIGLTATAPTAQAVTFEGMPTMSVEQAMACVARTLGPAPDRVTDVSRWPAAFPQPEQVRVVPVPARELQARGHFAEIRHAPANAGSPWEITVPAGIHADAGLVAEVAKLWPGENQRDAQDAVAALDRGSC